MKSDDLLALLMHYANKATVVDTIFSLPSRAFFCIPQRGVIQVLKPCLGRCIQLPLGNRFSELLTVGSLWEEVYAVELMWWLLEGQWALCKNEIKLRSRFSGVCLALKFENEIHTKESLKLLL